MSSPQSDSCPDSPPAGPRQLHGTRTGPDPADMDRTRRKRKAGEEPTPHKVIEKRRRDRINQRFEELRGLVPTARNSQGVKNDKVDLLHMTIEHLKALTGSSPGDTENDENCPQQTALPSGRGVIFTATDAVLAGFSECAYEALQFLLHEEHMPDDSELVTGLRAHLRNSQMSLDVHRVLHTHLPHPAFDSAPPRLLTPPGHAVDLPLTPPRHAVDMPVPQSPHTYQSPSQPTPSRSELAMPANALVPTRHGFSPVKMPNSPGAQISMQQPVPNSPGVRIGLQHPVSVPNSPGVQHSLQHPISVPNSPGVHNSLQHPVSVPNSPGVTHSLQHPISVPNSPGVQHSLQHPISVPNSPGVAHSLQHRLSPPSTTPNSTLSLPNIPPLTVAMATSTVARATASAAMATRSPSSGPMMPIFAYLPPRSYGYPVPAPPTPPQYAGSAPVSPYQPVFVGWLPQPPPPQ